MSESSSSQRRGGRARSGRGGGQRARVETSAGGVVYRRGGPQVSFLLIRDPYENWGLPKGHVEDEETPVQAAAREVAEETGLADIELRDELPTIDWYFRNRGRLVHKFCHFFLMESCGGEPRPQVEEGITACVWLPLEEAVSTVTYANAREVLRVAGSRIPSPEAGDDAA